MMFFFHVGVIATFICGIVLFVTFLYWLDCVILRCLDAKKHRIVQETEARIKHKLINDSWWFSEDPTTFGLIQRLASGQPVDSVREEWRKGRNEK